jgi:hypothetical protein
MTRTHSQTLAIAGPALVAEVLRRFGEARVRVAGTSMLPALRPREVLLIRHCTIDQVVRGDIVLFVAGARLFAHRVVQICLDAQPPFLITRGDTHHRDDLPVSSSRLLGRVAASSRNGRVRTQPFPYSRPGSACSIISNGFAVAIVRLRDTVQCRLGRLFSALRDIQPLS